MGRPPLALGTAGAVRCYKTDTGYRARVLVRHYNGAVRALERRTTTEAAAERTLKTALRDRSPVHTRGQITADSRVPVLGEVWYGGLADLSPVTMQAYRDRLDRQILPGLGRLRARELSIGVLDRHLRLVADKHGVSTARTCRSVLSGMCTLAAQHDALSHNPVRAVGPVNGRPRKAPRALTLPQLRQLLAALTYDDRATALDVPHLVRFLMATGLRIGEACGLAWNAVDLQAGAIEVRAGARRDRKTSAPSPRAACREPQQLRGFRLLQIGLPHGPPTAPGVRTWRARLQPSRPSLGVPRCARRRLPVPGGTRNE
jgi:integrase